MESGEPDTGSMPTMFEQEKVMEDELLDGWNRG